MSYISGYSKRYDKLLGNPDSNYLDESIFGFLKQFRLHFHATGKVYPNLANSITVVGGVGAWQFGNKVEIVPANAITTDFDIHWLNTYDSTATDEYQINLYYGDSEILLNESKTSKEANQSNVIPIPVMGRIIPANSKIMASLASSTGNDQLKLSVSYHGYYEY